MRLRVQILVILFSLALILIILELIRKGRLREEYSLVWLISASVIFVLAVFRGSLQLVADWVGIEYGPSLIFLIGLGFIAFIQLLQTVVISKLTAQNRDLAQALAILQWRVRELSRASSLEGVETEVQVIEPEAGTEPILAEPAPRMAEPVAYLTRED